MRDFAKASLFALVILQLKRTNPELIPTGAGSSSTLVNAHVAVETKSDILNTIWKEAGPEILLSCGQGVRYVAYDPIWQAALRSGNPFVLFNKWRRFEMFAHSRNRVRIEKCGENQMEFQRYTVSGGTPTIPENLFVCGLIIGLLEAIGCEGVSCEMSSGKGTKFCIRENDRFIIPGNFDNLDSSFWKLSWKSHATAIDETADYVDELDIEMPQVDNLRLRHLISKVLGLFTGDVSRQWKISDVSGATATSTRSLQRKLAQAGLNFSRLLRLVRIHEACRLLKDYDMSSTAIALCCGFCDSAHFSRDFRAGVGMTPSQYRAII